MELNFEQLSTDDKLFFLDSISFYTFYGMLCKYEDSSCTSLGNRLEIFELQNRGFLKITSEDIDFELLEKGNGLFGKKLDSLMSLANRIREIFPKGVKSGSGYVRSEQIDIANKLKGFFKKHKYTQEQVLQATQQYIDRKRSEGWAFISQAVFFIEKNGVSLLATECGNLDSTKEVNPFEIEA